MKKKKYLPLYYEWMKEGRLPRIGLCRSLEILGFKRLNESFAANEADKNDLNSHFLFYWVNYDFNGVRQNIILLLAAMNGEL
jgi:hypothetical protein